MIHRQTSPKGLFSAVALATLLVSSSALAQAVTVPTVAEPAAAEQRLRIIERPEVSTEPLIMLPEEGGQKPLKAGVKFKLQGVRIEGLTVMPVEQLKPIYQDYIGTEVTLATLQQITQKITATLRNQGYVLSRAVLPPQRISRDGIVTIRVVEGYVNSLRFDGAEPTSGLVAKYAEKIRSSKPLNSKDLERYLLLMEDLPGVEARAVIQPSPTTPGASDVIINLTEKKYEGSITADNRSSRFLGPYQGSATLQANNLFGWYDRTAIRILSTLGEKELRFGEIVHEEPIGSEGTRLALSASHTETDPGHTLEVFDVEGQSRTYTAALKHPFKRSRQENIFGTAEFVVRDTDVTALDDRLYEDRTRVLKIGGAYDFIDRWDAVNKIDFSVSKGFGIWDDDGAAGLRSRADGKTSFVKVNAEGSHLHTISGPVSLYVAAAGQWSADPLLASEEFALGGPDFGQAFDPSELTGDHGAATKLELQYNGFTPVNWLSTYQLYGFYDIGKVWNKNSIVTDDSESLSSTGLGVRFNVFEAVSGDLQVAVPLTHTVQAMGDDGRAPRAFFSLAYRF